LRWIQGNPEITRAQGSIGNAIEHFAEHYDHYREKFNKETILFHEEAQKQKETVSSPEEVSSFCGMPDPDDPDKDKKDKTLKKLKGPANLGKDYGKIGKVIRNTPGKIKKFSLHALERAMKRKVTKDMVLDTLTNPIVTLVQSGGKILRIGREAVAVLSKEGRLVTTYAKSNFDERILLILKEASTL